LEHVRDSKRAWRNMSQLLDANGVALAFIPTLFSPPFVINKIVPERVSGRILRSLFADRRHLRPKFPAYYDRCYGAQARLEPVIKACGFKEVLVVPFWTHGYFHRIPVLRFFDDQLQRLARHRDWRSLTSYAYLIARK
jgi:hypothetical protein